MFLIAFVGAPVAAHLLGHGPNDQFFNAVDENTFLPVGVWTHVQTLTEARRSSSSGPAWHDWPRPLPPAPVRRSDLAEVAVFADLHRCLPRRPPRRARRLLLRGGVTTVVSRLTEMIMAFPALLFIIAISATAGEQLNGITFGFLAHVWRTYSCSYSRCSAVYPARRPRPGSIAAGEGVPSRRPG